LHLPAARFRRGLLADKSAILPRMTRKGLAPVALVAAVVVIGWLVTGVGASDMLRFVAYDIGFVALPGAALLWAVRGHRPSFLVSVALGWPIGQALEILAFCATAAMGARNLFAAYPIAVIVASALVIWRRRGEVGENGYAELVPVAGMWIAAGTLSVGLVYLTLMFLPTAPLPGASAALMYSDYPYFISLIGQVMNHWPTTTPGLVGVSLSYEWFVLFHIAAASQVTHVPIAVIGLRLDYIPTIVVLACQLLVLGRYFGKSWWTGVAAVMIFFLMGPLDLTTAASPFGDDVMVHLWDSWTFPFGMTFLLALLYFITERLRSNSWRTRRDIASWGLIALLMIGASGAKATILPVIIGGTGLYAVIGILFRRGASVRALTTAAIALVIFIVAYILVYGGSTPATKVDLFFWLSGGPAVTYVELIRHADIRAILLPFAYLADFIGVMLPLSGALYLLRRRHRHEISAFALPLCMLVTGVLIACLVHHSSYSELYFVDTGYVAGCLAAAQGYRLAWSDIGPSLNVSRRAVVVGIACWIALLLIVVNATEHSLDTPQAIFFRYAGIAAAALVFVIACAVVLRILRRSTSGIMAVALIPVVAAAALTSPMLAYPTVHRVLTGVPVSPGRTVLTPGLLTALYWFRNHTPTDAVFAVNNHWLDPGRVQTKEYYYTAFTERQAFIESYNPYPIPPGPGTPAGANFIHRQQLNDAVFDHGDAQALRILTHQYGVRYLLIDRTLGPYDPALIKLGRVVFSNPDATIIAVE
jgi:hypothetical protein